MTRSVFTLSTLVLSAGLAAPAAAQEACGRLPTGAADHVCTCTGSETGSVWGSGPYTADSNICVAARHAGAIAGMGGQVRVIAAPGEASYTGSSAFGVQTSNWGSYGSSFHVTSAQATASCSGYPGGEGPHVCGCNGDERGSVWGSGPYTADSNLCAAALHDGAIGPGGGVVTVLGIGGLPSYRASQANGISTSNWGSYGASVIFNRN